MMFKLAEIVNRMLENLIHKKISQVKLVNEAKN